jgi:hypothetical protein
LKGSMLALFDKLRCGSGLCAALDARCYDIRLSRLRLSGKVARLSFARCRISGSAGRSRARGESGVSMSVGFEGFELSSLERALPMLCSDMVTVACLTPASSEGSEWRRWLGSEVRRRSVGAKRWICFWSSSNWESWDGVVFCGSCGCWCRSSSLLTGGEVKSEPATTKRVSRDKNLRPPRHKYRNDPSLITRPQLGSSRQV